MVIPSDSQLDFHLRRKWQFVQNTWFEWDFADHHPTRRHRKLQLNKPANTIAKFNLDLSCHFYDCKKNSLINFNTTKHSGALTQSHMINYYQYTKAVSYFN